MFNSLYLPTQLSPPSRLRMRLLTSLTKAYICGTKIHCHGEGNENGFLATNLFITQSE